MLQTENKQNLLSEDLQALRIETMSDLEHYRDLKIKEAHLKAELEKVQDKLKGGWFFKNEAFFNDSGLEIATCKIQVAMRFNSTQFKAEHPKMYEKYRNQEIITQPLKLAKYF